MYIDNDFRDLEDKLSDWDMLPIWIRVIMVVAIVIGFVLIVGRLLI